MPRMSPPLEPSVLSDFATFAPPEEVQPHLSESQMFEPLLDVNDDEGDWFPWANRREALFDIMSSFPRSVFSEKELSSVKWLLESLGLGDKLPCTDKLRRLRDAISAQFGAETSTVDGQCGNIFSYNDVESVIRNEFANPLVRPYLETYAQRSGKRREHLFQGDKWVSEIDASLAGPMARYNGQDYFVDEVALADLDKNLQSCPVILFSTIDELTLRTGPNPWREKANGLRVLAVPLGAYGDDTSGNVSKKWNKHVSFLYLLAGLPREFLHLAYHIHFFSTSNVAKTLEMLAAFKDIIRDAQATGWEVWDCLYNEKVLVIPWVLLLEGDNPMHSEFCSHVGLAGKHFCRVCPVSRGDKPEGTGNDTTAHETQVLSDFMKCHPPRTREDVLSAVQTQLETVLRGAPSQVPPLQTSSGVKDAFFLHFYEKLSTLCADAKAASLDPTVDTPVEILHVILLGFVKYFWRDAVSQISTEQKAELMARLASVDISGLGIDRIQPRTLVQYAGSLVGRDFRTILHVAPSVLPGLISSESYRAWLALCNLAAFVFRPVIEDIDTYIFHIILHLPRHIRRFGPAPLYATEAFESFNHVIRLRSIHSNRHAPSLDIAHAFSHLHAIRHLLSGGWFPDDTLPNSPPRQAGEKVLQLIHDSRLVDYMGMQGVIAPSRQREYLRLRQILILTGVQLRYSYAIPILHNNGKIRRLHEAERQTLRLLNRHAPQQVKLF
ncbi:hypothetical protein EXIGLDRAFT_668241 [Exidia glandulosa HHB12029]|uniref:Uncharacterized protein n=1 Tax=Exidia glandulosa HHB12029 TaxID=1314781 RepID=A0A165MPA3_EXIGL|nr:hypothetical protein EXIGLDRAFT_668241 [Exidia glandulosa HHB12029]